MLRARTLVAGIAVALLVSACQVFSDTGQVLEAFAPPTIRPLAAPRDRPAQPHPSLAEEFDLTQSCDSIGQFADVPLPFLPDPPQASGTPICFAESGSPGRQLPDKGGPEPWRVHVLYVPKDVDLSQDDYLEILEQGGIDMSLGFNGPERPIPGEARPDEPAGGYAPFEVRGERGVVQRFSEKRTFAVWWEGLPGKGRVRHVVHGFYPPEEIVEFAAG